MKSKAKTKEQPFMSDISSSQPTPPSPEDIKQYQTDYQKSFDLFDKSFKQYTQPKLETHKKEMFKNVMDEALKVMNETACVALKNERDREKEAKLNKDYHTFMRDPSVKNQDNIHQDLEEMR